MIRFGAGLDGRHADHRRPPAGAAVHDPDDPGAVPAPTISGQTARRGTTTVANPLIAIAEHSDTHVSLRLSDGSPADWTVDGDPAGTATRMITVPLDAGVVDRRDGHRSRNLHVLSRLVPLRPADPR